MGGEGQTLDLRKRIVGWGRTVPLLDGRQARYVNLDNAATTPPLVDVVETLKEFLPYYASVHRGAGFKSRWSTMAFEEAREIVAKFVGANLRHDTVIFGLNATGAINKLSYRLCLPRDFVVISTLLEHHSNDLPWRRRAQVVRVRATPDGPLDEEDFDRQLQKYAGRIGLVAVTGASNVTGYLPPIHRLARKAHEAGAEILVDAAQLAPHRPIDMKPPHDPEHLDYVVISAHKMYAPFGSGALIGPKAAFLCGDPEYCGGGAVQAVTTEHVDWADPPDREEAGTPNVVGAVAMAAAAKALMEIGMERIAAREEKLVHYALSKLRKVKGVILYGETDPAKAHERVGVIPFNVEGVHHALVAAVLGYEGGIGVRNGCFCAHPYVVHLLGLTRAQAEGWRTKVLAGDRSGLPGMVRASFGCYTREEDIDRWVEMLERIARKDFARYELNPGTGEFSPTGYSDPEPKLFGSPARSFGKWLRLWSKG
ncbi:MAG: aminotransferase class V-fold PLP-dependent enzyme [bacterium]|jgi:selenocysteine lyase/cysteine desulfurase|nr:aminotransferase class V-fold PLP-dependent enzyme [candidate division KSB1 bacterium]MDH7560825.1 aminotransferase class V-fold PLP-dependent enzyme [bacterium]